MSQNLPSYLTISSDISEDIHDAIERISPDKMAVLVDENSKKFCLPHLKLSDVKVIEIKSGEQNKTLQTCDYLWTELTKEGFTRKSLLINLGGGVIGDMGGFVAATFKRGMSFINIPTTLLSQVDASIGGKLGIDFNGLKNHIGLFQEPSKVLIFPEFLKTLSERELKSGFAEVIKHALIRSSDQWNYLTSNSFGDIDWIELIPKSIAIKNGVVTEDPRESGVRKILNYGHTIGHAIESYFLETDIPLLHGEAVALGMLIENDIAVKMGMLDEKAAQKIKAYISSIYTFPKDLPDYSELKNQLFQDKKNDKEGIRFSLLDKVGSCTYDVLVKEQILSRVLR